MSFKSCLSGNNHGTLSLIGRMCGSVWQRRHSKIQEKVGQKPACILGWEFLGKTIPDQGIHLLYQIFLRIAILSNIFSCQNFKKYL